MKDTTIDQINRGAPAVAGVIATLTLSDISLIVGICVGVLTGVYVIAQLLYLLWKWRKESKD